MAGYKIECIEKIEDHITFIRINPTNIELTLKEVFQSLSDLSWLSQFDAEYTTRGGFEIRAESTIKYIAKKIIRADDEKITSSSGEYVVSELARKSIVEELKYLDIPLAELIKIKDVGNHGFDFYSKNQNFAIVFGESKYLSSANAYGKAFKGISSFINDRQDLSDMIDIDKFCCDISRKNFTEGRKAFAAAFSSKTISTSNLIDNIKKNKEFIELKKFSEIICIAVNI